MEQGGRILEVSRQPLSSHRINRQSPEYRLTRLISGHRTEGTESQTDHDGHVLETIYTRISIPAPHAMHSGHGGEDEHVDLPRRVSCLRCARVTANHVAAIRSLHRHVAVSAKRGGMLGEVVKHG
jgi:hypothetical protein